MEQIILFTFLILFPFGQIIRIGIIHPVDVAAGIGALWVIIKRYEQPEIFKYFKSFVIAAFFSWILSFSFFGTSEVFYGGLYLLRLFFYSYFFVLVWHFVRARQDNAKLLVSSLLTLSFVSAVFGWIQYFWITDTRALFYLGWDDHYLRLIGTFLDPTYLGLIIVFGLIIAIRQSLATRGWRYAGMSLFLIISLAFTYSRASYLAFFAGLFVILLAYKKLKYLLFIGLGFLLLMLALPTAKNTTLYFTRAFSAINRIENYKETFEIFKASPVFGVGYNNLCPARAKLTGNLNFASHSCFGSDSSLLFILTTTGISGFFVFLWSLWNIFQLSRNNLLFTSVLSALMIHSLFSNSLVYSWVMGYMLILLAAASGDKGKGQDLFGGVAGRIK